MTKLYPLYSSSSGNLYVLEDGDTNILIDCGVSYRALSDGLNLINKVVDDINAVMVTHEHIDHVRGLNMLIKKHDIPIYTCSKTGKYLKQNHLTNASNYNINDLKYDKPYDIFGIEVIPFETSHDAVMPCGFKIMTKNNKSIGFATDLGYVTSKNMDYLKGSDFIILEANYDESMLNFGRYPYPLKRRIASDLGHLSNDVSANTINELITNNTNRFLMSHMSVNNNTKEIANQTIKSILEIGNCDLKNVQIDFATKNLSSEVYNI